MDEDLSIRPLGVRETRSAITAQAYCTKQKKSSLIVFFYFHYDFVFVRMEYESPSAKKGCEKKYQTAQ